MRIAHITSTFPPYQGGIGNACWHQVLELARLGHEVTVFTPIYDRKNPTLPPLIRGGADDGSPPPVKGELEGVYSVERLKPLFKYGNAAFVPQVFYALKDFDIIHLHYPFFGGAEAVWLAKRLKQTRVSLVLQYHMDTAGSGFLKRFFAVYRRLFLPKIIKLADRVIVATGDYAENSDLKEFIKREPQKFVKIPFGVDTERFRPAEKDAGLLVKYNLNKKDKIILFVGGLDRAHYFKGIDVLIKSFALIKDLRFPRRGGAGEIEDLRLLIVGDGDLRAGHESLAENLGVGDKIIFAGSVSDEDLPKYYNLADIFVLPSIDKSEAFGLVLLEAMACAKPVIASDLPGVRQVAEGAGFLVESKNAEDLAEKIKSLLDNDRERRELGLRGRKKVEEKYNWKSAADKLSAVYDVLKTGK